MLLEKLPANPSENHYIAKFTFYPLHLSPLVVMFTPLIVLIGAILLNLTL